MSKPLLLGVDGNPLAYDSAYQGASLTRRELSSWQPTLRSADAELDDALTTLVSRSRDLVRNNGVASGAVQTLVDNVVGTGLRLSALPDYKGLGFDKAWADDWSRQVEALWRSWAESKTCDAANGLTFAGLTAQVFRACIVNGEALALPLWLSERSQFATCLQLVESDCLSTPPHRLDDEQLRQGIEIDRYGAPTAYWLCKKHPGDSFSGLTENDWQRIPAATRFGRLRVLHVHDQARTGQR